MVYDTDGNIICNDDNQGGGSHTDAECTNAFLSYMAKKCTQYGMSGTYYASPSGLTQDSYSTPQDMLKLAVAVGSYPKAMDIWATPSQSFSIKGSAARTLSVTNGMASGIGAQISAGGYQLLGGKGGSLIYSAYHKAWILHVDVDGHAVALALMAYGQSQYDHLNSSAVELCDMVKQSLDGSTPTEGQYLQELISGNGGYAACIIPQNACAYLNYMSPAQIIGRDNSVSNSATVSRYPASTSKAMTLLCALDFITNIHEIITVKTVDISTGSGSTFYNGDQLTMEDALKIMMMESSNTLANTIARVTGRKILAN